MVGSERNKWTSLILFGGFVTIGIVGVAMKSFARTLSAGEPVFLTLMFITAAIGTQVVVFLAKPNLPQFSDLSLGAALGLTNVISNYGIIYALQLFGRKGTHELLLLVWLFRLSHSF